jgi:hypothetical protein
MKRMVALLLVCGGTCFGGDSVAWTTNQAMISNATPNVPWVMTWTNSVMGVTNFPLVDSPCGKSNVADMVKAGDVCAIIGHRWAFGCGKEGCVAMHPEPLYHCVICGVVVTEKERRLKNGKLEE